MADEQDIASAAAPSGGSGGNKLVTIISIVNMVVTLGIVAVLFLSYQREKSQPTVQDIVNGQVAPASGGAKGAKGEKAKKQAAEEANLLSDSGKIIALDPFTVNLATGVGMAPRYVRMNVSIELKKGVSDREFNIKLPRVRDTIINLLNSKRVTDIDQTAGREQLKREIKRAVNDYMIQSKVKGVYFTNFAISN